MKSLKEDLSRPLGPGYRLPPLTVSSAETDGVTPVAYLLEQFVKDIPFVVVFLAQAGDEERWTDCDRRCAKGANSHVVVHCLGSEGR